MNLIDINCEDIDPPDWINSVPAYINHVLTKLDRDRWEISVVFCKNKYIKRINWEYRRVDEPTDVLSFPQISNPEDIPNRVELAKSNAYFLAGDIFISLEALMENTSFFNVEYNEELRRLLIHGILHLSGLDHSSNDLTEDMLVLQERLLTEIKERIE